MHRQFGMTLVELLTVVGTVSLMLSFAIPGLSHYLHAQGIDAEARSILRLIYATRKTSVTSGDRMVFCGVDRDRQCSRDNIVGWAIFKDKDHSHALSENNTLVAYAESDPGQHVRLRASNQSYVTYNVDGSARQFGSVYVCGAKQGEGGKRISINRAGRPYIVRNSKTNAKKIAKNCR